SRRPIWITFRVPLTSAWHIWRFPAAGCCTRRRRESAPAFAAAIDVRARGDRRGACARVGAGRRPACVAEGRRRVDRRSGPADSRARRYGHGLVLGFGLGPGTGPDGAGDHRAPERAAEAGPGATTAMRRRRPSEIALQTLPFTRFCRQNNSGEGTVLTVRCAIVLYTSFRRPGALRDARVRECGHSLVHCNGPIKT